MRDRVYKTLSNLQSPWHLFNLQTCPDYIVPSQLDPGKILCVTKG